MATGERAVEHWIDDHLPDWLPDWMVDRGPYHLHGWQWLGLPLAVSLAWFVGFLASKLTQRLLGWIPRHTAWGDALRERSGGPLTLAWSLALLRLLLPWLGLEQSVHASMQGLLSSGFLLLFFWCLLRVIEVGGQQVARSPWALDHSAARTLIPLGARVLKLLLVAIAIVAILSDLGYPVASLVAGLGIGGLALALAAQKTVENLFGTFSIGVDQPFRPGDFVRIEGDVSGTVETIGLRSTKLRTPDRTLVSIPNGKLADMRIESFTARDRMRLRATVSLPHTATRAQTAAVLAGFERVLRGQPKIWPQSVLVRLRELAASTLDIEVVAWFVTADDAEFQLIRQAVLLDFMEVVERAGTSLALPAQTVHLVGAPNRQGKMPSSM